MDWVGELFAEDQKQKMIAYLDANGYGTVYDWALDSDYTLHGLLWLDESGNVIDPLIQLWFALEAADSFDENVGY